MKRLISNLILLLLITASSVFADNIRGNLLENIEISDRSSSEGRKFNMHIEDIFAVSIDASSGFIKGFEVELRLPQNIRQYGGSFALNVFKMVTPEIDRGVGTYFGRKYSSMILPDSAKFFIRIPVSEQLEPANDPYTKVLTSRISYSESPLIFTILPIMKGFPSSLYSSDFTVTVRPIFLQAGTLSIDLNLDEELDRDLIEISIDGKEVSSSLSQRLPAGEHSLTVSAEGGRSATKTFSIEAGETTTVDVQIEKLISRLIVDAPETAITYIDGERVDFLPGTPIEVEPGEHLVLFKIGDYKISKKFAIKPGKDCKISLFLDIFIEEN